MVIEFGTATTRRSADTRLLCRADALREPEDIMAQYPIVYPNEAVLRAALRGFVAYGISWYDAHSWAYADAYGLAQIISADFKHGRLNGSVVVRNPFIQTA